MGRLCEAIQFFDIVNIDNIGREAAVRAKNTVLHHGSKGEVVEDLSKEMPNMRRCVFSHALVIEAVDLCNLPALMVAPKQENAIRIAHLEKDDKSQSLNAVISSVNVVSKKQEICRRGMACNSPEFMQIEELSMNIPDYSDRRRDRHNIFFFCKRLLGKGT